MPDAINALLRQLLEQMDELAVILINPNSEIIAWLPGAERVFGYEASEVLGKSFTILFTPEDRKKGMPEFEIQVANQDGHAEDDRWMMRKDGGRFWATGTLTPIRDAQRKLLAYGKTLRNRTDIKTKLEALEARARDAEQAGDQKNTFIMTLAHELRTPLGSIANAKAILETFDETSVELTFAIATIDRQLEHMRRLIDDLLELVRARAGKVVLHKQEIVLNDVVRFAVESCQPKLDEERKFSLVMPTSPILVDGDVTRLQQVFVNLIGNAFKYTSRGDDIWVKLSVDGPSAVAKVVDSGMGISAEMLPQIFELFTQAPSEKQNCGLGIGLSLVKDQVSLHGGTVQVRSEGIQKGSEFTVQLPLAGADGARPNMP